MLCPGDETVSQALCQAYEEGRDPSHPDYQAPVLFRIVRRGSQCTTVYYIKRSLLDLLLNHRPHEACQPVVAALILEYRRIQIHIQDISHILNSKLLCLLTDLLTTVGPFTSLPRQSGGFV